MKPNIILFVPDTFRADALGHLGNPASRTPTLDTLVGSGEAVSFANNYCQNPICTPSRCSFMSGLYPHVAGHRTLTNMMEPHEPVLLKTMKDNGYFVWWGGRDDLIPAENSHDPYCDILYRGIGKKTHNLHGEQSWRSAPGTEDYYSFYAGRLDPTDGDKYYDLDWQTVEGAVDFIGNYRGEKPYCMYIALANPHAPYGIEEPWYSMIDRDLVTPPVPVPDWERKPSMLKGIYDKQGLENYSPEKWAELGATYLGMCARVDAQLGMVLGALKNRNVYDDTALFFFSDHGDFTGDYGLVEKSQNTLEDCLTHVPLIIKPPRGVELRAGINAALTELVDVVPTVCDFAGIELDYDQFGRSLRPQLAGATEHRDAVFCEGGRLHGEVQAMESGAPELLQPDALYWPKISTQHLEGPEHTKAVMCRTREYKYVYRLYEIDEFYDLTADPGELHNLIDEPEHRERILAFRERTLRFMVETCDTVPRRENRRF